jgi:chaperone modulatory protein CbpM
MIETREFLMRARLDADVLEAWLEVGWLLPQENQQFSEMDLARAQLIADLKHDLGVNDEGIAVVLDLVDQVYGLRRTLRELLTSIHAQPEATRRKIAAGLREVAEKSKDGDAPRSRRGP